jgi:4-hydroxythreonine-4-phosphate dehydrogenase
MMRSANQADVLVCDAETDADLRAIASASMELERKVVWVGSAGLAYHLPRALGLVETGTVTQIAMPPPSGPLLFVVGSLSRTSTEQVKALTASTPTMQLIVPPEVLIAGEESARWQGYQRQLELAFEMNQDVVLSPAPEPLVKLASRLRLSASLAALTASTAGKVGALIAAGGETARAVLQNWGINNLRLLGELEKGVPVSMAENWSRQLPVITKAGDFGGPEELLKCRQFLHSTNQRLSPLAL